MPEFILDTGSPAAATTFASLPEFVQRYIEALFFTDTGTGDDSDLEHVTFADLEPETLERIQRDCDAFADRFPATFWGREREAGRDFWYTRNGHGCGFWDGDWPHRFADRLTAESETFGQVDLYLGDDSRLYLA